jgi:phospholipase C
VSRLARVARLAALAALIVLAGASVAAAAEAKTRTPIKHFMVLMQENHSFDNYFGTYPGANGTPKGTCQPLSPDRPNGKCVKPYPIGRHAIQDLGHSTLIFAAQYRNGAMNGFVSGLNANNLDGHQAMGYYDDSDLPFYWNVADSYVLFDHFFTSAAAGSVWNHLFWVTGTPGNPLKDGIPETGFGNLPTIFDRLEAKGITWKFYVQHYDPKVTYKSATVGNAGSQPVWVPLLDYDRYIDNPKLFSHIVDIDQYFEDLQNGTLPEVAFMVPAGSSEHPPGSIQSGQRYVRAIVNALMRSPYWKSSAFSWTYDDWGGWYDHVKPPRVDAYGYGFRAPALLVSAYAKKGHIDSTTYDFTSYLAFIEHNWGLKPLAARDAAALREGRDLTNAFDFTKPPRTAVFLQGQRRPPPVDTTRRWVVYMLYGGAMILSALVIGTAAAVTARRRRGAGKTGRGLFGRAGS